MDTGKGNGARGTGTVQIDLATLLGIWPRLQLGPGSKVSHAELVLLTHKRFLLCVSVDSFNRRFGPRKRERVTETVFEPWIDLRCQLSRHRLVVCYICYLFCGYNTYTRLFIVFTKNIGGHSVPQNTKHEKNTKQNKTHRFFFRCIFLYSLTLGFVLASPPR